ncbi:MAG: hypothetical protein K0S32_42 [Bacteroidetes bacterium]|jgi:hypothetical protein|nr:hypothetical protein [Bacteroidota bacterium]
MTITNDWKKSHMQVFWGEIAPCNHLVQIYDNDVVFLNSLEGFAGSGFLNNESVIIIATEAHLKALDERLTNQGFDLELYRSTDQYIALNAHETLAKFMKEGWPNDILFVECVGKLIDKGRRNNRKVRAFGEMVAILWEQGNKAATVRLENLWTQFCGSEGFSLFCAYPKTGFTQDAATSIQHICETHSKIISGSANPTTEIHYRDSQVAKAD